MSCKKSFVVPLAFCIAACDPSPSVTGLRPEDRSRAELEIYAVIVREHGEFAALPLADSTWADLRAFGGRNCEQVIRSNDKCAAGFDEAWRDYLSLNAVRAPHQRGVAAALSVRFRSEVPRETPSCKAPAGFGLSRIGFDRTLKHAVVSFGAAVGTGPMPGCGWATAGTVLFERIGGLWKHTGSLDEWIT